VPVLGRHLLPARHSRLRGGSRYPTICLQTLRCVSRKRIHNQTATAEVLSAIDAAADQRTLASKARVAMQFSGRGFQLTAEAIRFRHCSCLRRPNGTLMFAMEVDSKLRTDHFALGAHGRLE
jgi:hypothetical protein